MEYEIDLDSAERTRIREVARIRAHPLSIDIETTSVENFKDLTGVTANVIVVWEGNSPSRKWIFVKDESLHLEGMLPMSQLRSHLINWFKRGRVLGGQNILGFDFPVLMADSSLDVEDILQAFIDTRQIVDTSKYITDRYGFRVSLKYMAAGSIGGEKLMDGAEAPIEWDKGNYQEVIDYCVQDTVLWADIHRYGVEHGYINIGGPKLKVDW